MREKVPGSSPRPLRFLGSRNLCPLLTAVAGRVGGNIILLMLEFNSLSSSNFLSR